MLFTKLSLLMVLLCPIALFAQEEGKPDYNFRAPPMSEASSSEARISGRDADCSAALEVNDSALLSARIAESPIGRRAINLVLDFNKVSRYEYSKIELAVDVFRYLISWFGRNPQNLDPITRRKWTRALQMSEEQVAGFLDDLSSLMSNLSVAILDEFGDRIFRASGDKQSPVKVVKMGDIRWEYIILDDVIVDPISPIQRMREYYHLGRIRPLPMVKIRNSVLIDPKNLAEHLSDSPIDHIYIKISEDPDESELLLKLNLLTLKQLKPLAKKLSFPANMRARIKNRLALLEEYSKIQNQRSSLSTPTWLPAGMNLPSLRKLLEAQTKLRDYYQVRVDYYYDILYRADDRVEVKLTEKVKTTRINKILKYLMEYYSSRSPNTKDKDTFVSFNNENRLIENALNTEIFYRNDRDLIEILSILLINLRFQSQKDFIGFVTHISEMARIHGAQFTLNEREHLASLVRSAGNRLHIDSSKTKEYMQASFWEYLSLSEIKKEMENQIDLRIETEDKVPRIKQYIKEEEAEIAKQKEIRRVQIEKLDTLDKKLSSLASQIYSGGALTPDENAVSP